MPDSYALNILRKVSLALSLSLKTCGCHRPAVKDLACGRCFAGYCSEACKAKDKTFHGMLCGCLTADALLLRTFDSLPGIPGIPGTPLSEDDLRVSWRLVDMCSPGLLLVIEHLVAGHVGTLALLPDGIISTALKAFSHFGALSLHPRLPDHMEEAASFARTVLHRNSDLVLKHLRSADDVLHVITAIGCGIRASKFVDSSLNAGLVPMLKFVVAGTDVSQEDKEDMIAHLMRDFFQAIAADPAFRQWELLQDVALTFPKPAGLDFYEAEAGNDVLRRLVIEANGANGANLAPLLACIVEVGESFVQHKANFILTHIDKTRSALGWRPSAEQLDAMHEIAFVVGALSHVASAFPAMSSVLCFDNGLCMLNAWNLCVRQLIPTADVVAFVTAFVTLSAGRDPQRCIYAADVIARLILAAPSPTDAETRVLHKLLNRTLSFAQAEPPSGLNALLRRILRSAGPEHAAALAKTLAFHPLGSLRHEVCADKSISKELRGTMRGVGIQCENPACTGTKHLKSCSKCFSVKYCSRECQAAHWGAHKPTCTERLLPPFLSCSLARLA